MQLIHLKTLPNVQELLLKDYKGSTAINKSNISMLEGRDVVFSKYSFVNERDKFHESTQSYNSDKNALLVINGTSRRNIKVYSITDDKPKRLIFTTYLDRLYLNHVNHVPAIGNRLLPRSFNYSKANTYTPFEIDAEWDRILDNKYISLEDYLYITRNEYIKIDTDLLKELCEVRKEDEDVDLYETFITMVNVKDTKNLVSSVKLFCKIYYSYKMSEVVFNKILTELARHSNRYTYRKSKSLLQKYFFPQ